MSARCCCAQLSNSSGVTARTSARMSAWLAPQSSAHWPRNVPPALPRGILNQVLFTWPGTPSTLPPSLGIHQEWITSEALTSSVTVVPVGTTIS